MHELSIVTSLIRLANDHRPAGARVERVCIDIGPLQMVEPEAMRWAWQAARAGTAFEESELEMHLLPWSLKCAACESTWQAEELQDSCRCGSAAITIVGGDQLLLVSLDVFEPTNEEREQAI